MPASYPRIPYGWADFRAIRLENRLYVDKTRFVHALEEERYAFFIRPRRFGKSCWVSLLDNYYSRKRADDFEAVFGGTSNSASPWTGSTGAKTSCRCCITSAYSASAMWRTECLGWAFPIKRSSG